jgi:hypothetical protein
MSATLDILYKKCAGEISITVTDDDEAPVPGATVIGTLYDHSLEIVPQIEAATFVETPADSGIYVFVFDDTFDPEAGIAQLDVRITNGVSESGSKFFEIKELVIS